MDLVAVSTWKTFCETLASAATIFDDPNTPKDSLSQIEGLRYLSRLTRVALESIIESSDVDYPRLFQMSNEIVKIGGDNPDNSYWNANISSSRKYQITGNRGSIKYLSFGTKANRFSIDGGMSSTGELDQYQMNFDADGNFKIIISKERVEGNWLPMEKDTSLLLVRQTFLDRANEIAAQIKIECLDPQRETTDLIPSEFYTKLMQAGKFVGVTSGSFQKWSSMFKASPNELLPWDQSIFQKVGGDPNIHYLHGYWKLEEDEAWIIETEIPDCKYWNFVIQNWWMESFDYVNINNVKINSGNARVNNEGRLVIVVAPTDPGVGNWISTASHSEGTALLRWVGASSFPIPTCRIAKIDSLKND